MRPIIIAGNWKMNKLATEVESFFCCLENFVDSPTLKDIVPVICPSFVYIERCKKLSEHSSIQIGAQDVSSFPNGAYTGDISAEMLKSLGVNYCIVAHSERRIYYNECTDNIILKINKLVECGIIPIFCIGENEDQRVTGQTFEVLKNQLSEILLNIKKINDIDLVIAYEPVWAIGTGKTATPDLAQEAHNFIRNWLRESINPSFAEKTVILYGGSVSPENLQDLLLQDDIDGGLIGGASLDPEKFKRMVKTAISFKER